MFDTRRSGVVRAIRHKLARDCCPLFVGCPSSHLNVMSDVEKKKLTEAQLAEFRQAFQFFDRDGDGSITKGELGRVMRSLGQFASEDELCQILREVDIDGDGNFTFNEFVEIISNVCKCTLSSPEDEEKELREAFNVFDKHGRGFISASDLRVVLQCLGESLSEEEIEDMIAEVDLDGDGRIDFDEFVHALVEPNEVEETSECVFEESKDGDDSDEEN